MSHWQSQLANAFRHPHELLQFLNLDHELNPINQDLTTVTNQFSFLVTRYYAERIQKGNPQDPLLLQILPTSNEDNDHAGFVNDPVGDNKAIKTPGLLQKYQGRALLILTGTCPIHCRYCFRREFPYQQQQLGSAHEQLVIDSLAKQPNITEIILSGGDPLILGNRRLEQLIQNLQAIPHIKRLRIHTRVPTTLPSRIDDQLKAVLSNTRLKTVLVTHINHPNEISEQQSLNAIAKLAEANVHLLNQSVLLRNINSDAKTLVELSEALFSAGISPYYLHKLDKTRGTAHFEVSDSMAQAIYQELQSLLPGYLVPKLVREIPGQPSKTLQ
ncbi:MAG: EF-P beta-lysylation protein EpmB [Gammaproteobacteria bacterium]|nr:EF-P beta-lysylation protein EpmB [Gammaproteobacteria bacterium]